MALLLEDYSGYEKVADITVLAVERLQGVKCPYGEYQDIRYKNISLPFQIYLFAPRFHHRPKWRLLSTQYYTIFQEP